MEALGNGAVLIRMEMIFTSPLPSPASQTHPLPTDYAGGVEFFLEGFEVAEVFLITSAMVVGSPRRGLHDVPEHGVVHVASAIVADGARMSSGWR